MQFQTISLEDRLENIRGRIGDQVDVSEITTVVAEVMGSFEGDIDLKEAHFQDELRDLLAYIENAKADISDIQPKFLSENKIPEASNQLDRVIETTEEATSKIMDSAEEIADIAATQKGKLAEKLETISMQIFEASSFQDITGQRVTKVVKTLQYLEEKLSDLARAIGDEDSHIRAKEEASNVNPDSDENLLQGPQCHETGLGNNQDAIDALLSSFD